MGSGQKEKKEKTFNRLPAEFQWKEGMDEEHIYPKELEMIETLKTAFPEIQGWNNKLVLYYLFARRCDVESTKLLLQDSLKILKEFNLLDRRLTFEESKLRDSPLYFFKNNVDVNDRPVIHFDAGRMTKKNTREIVFPQQWYEIQFMTDNYTLRYLRNGLSIVADAERSSLRHVDTSASGKALYKEMTGTFPRRLRSIVVVNTGFAFAAMYQVVKLFTPRKLTKRITLFSSSKQLFEFVPVVRLPTSLGGTSGLTYDKFIEQMEQYDQQYQAAAETAAGGQ